ncbi:E3 ubiquitin/ISG15 ligase TRIM25-like [Bombina bombina]|uniref:E3 ubiquitin/ISG15 ligase TRIM25-like n=1 Tax=Bombina bombina TaxID=8345 RepID=UPI00235ABFC4|nr:E3 ubiquitin/ISG15 ligase TRIM25-like [Bombina bombina]
MAFANLREELNCSICLGIYTEPVMLICGHNFCLGCIKKTWDSQGPQQLTCPECRHIFVQKPDLKRNLKLRNIVEHFLHMNPDKGDTTVFCSYCIHTQVPAVKSCLLCEALLCDNHVRAHTKSEEHVLTDPTTSWDGRKCSVHKKILEYYCSKDASCICASCYVTGEHKGHQVWTLHEASEQKKEKLRNGSAKLASKIEETEKRFNSLQTHKRNLQEISAGETERVTAIFTDIREHLKVQEEQVLGEITRQKEHVLKSVADLSQQLEKEKEELTAQMCYIEELCNISDPLTILQEQVSHNDDFYDAEKEDKFDKAKPDTKDLVGSLDKTKISVMLHCSISEIVSDVKAKYRFCLQVSDMLLDLKTACNYVGVSSDLKTATCLSVHQKRPETPEQFTNCQVLSTKSFSSGQHYWEVETSEAGTWIIGVVYSSIERKGCQSWIGNNKKSWCLNRCNVHINKERLSVQHGLQITPLSHKSTCTRFGILLDYEAGRLAFFELSELIRHLYTFNATFTEPLYAAFCLYDKSWIRIRG